MQQVNLKGSQFIEMSVAGWFTIIEVQFLLRKITVEDTKFYTIISTLPHKAVTILPASILQYKDYEQLKQSVLSAYEMTKPELLEKLMKTTTVSGHPLV